MPALQVALRERNALAGALHDKPSLLKVSLPAAGDAVGALLAAITPPPLSQVAIRAPNALPLSKSAIVGRFAYCKYLPLLGKDGIGCSSSVMAAAHDAKLKVAAAAGDGGRCAHDAASQTLGPLLPTQTHARTRDEPTAAA